MVVKKGLAYGIDFRGGTVVTVKFAKAPNLDAIRSELDRQNLRGATIQRIGVPSDHEVIIGLDLKTTTSSEALDQGKRAIVTALSGLFGQGQAGKLDFNNSSPQTVSDHLVAADPLGLSSKGFDSATKTYRDLAEALINFRNTPPRSGLISDFQELSSVPGVNAGVIATLRNDFYLSSFAVKNTEIVGPKVGKDLRRQALYVTLAGLGAMLVYIWFRFELSYGVAAVVATFHDVIITLGFFSLLNKEITLTVIAALLTLVGYSMNDTIVVFDRIRENVRLNKRENIVDLINRSINQTLSRTILTSGFDFPGRCLFVPVRRRGHPRFLVCARRGSNYRDLLFDFHCQSHCGLLSEKVGRKCGGGEVQELPPRGCTCSSLVIISLLPGSFSLAGLRNFRRR